MRARRRYVPVVGAVGVAIVLWIVLGDAGTDPDRLERGPVSNVELSTGRALDAPMSDEPVTSLLDEQAAPVVARDHRTITGSIRDEAGAPVAGATVFFESVGEARDQAMSDVNGAFRVAVPEGRGASALRARHPSYAAGRAVVLLSPDGPHPSTIDFVLADTVEIRGVVRWDDGSPCVGAQLVLRGNAPRARLAPASLDAPLAEAVTGDDGSFEFGAMPAGRIVRVGVTVDGFSPSSPYTFEVTDAEEQFWELRLARPASLRVFLLAVDDGADGALGDPLDRSTLALRYESGGSELIATSTVVDRSAEFVGLDSRAVYRLELSTPGHRVATLRRGLAPTPGLNDVHASVPELVPTSTRTSPAPLRWTLPWELTNASGDVLSFWDVAERVGVSGLVIGGATVESLSTGEREWLTLECMGSDAHGAVDVAVEPPVRVEVDVGGATFVRDLVTRGERLSLVLTRDAADSIGIDFRSVDTRGHWVPVLHLVVLDIATGMTRVVAPGPDDAALRCRLAPGSYRVVGRPLFGFPATELRLDVERSDHGRIVDVVFSGGGAIRGRLVPAPAAGQFVELFLSGPGLDALMMSRDDRALHDGSFELSQVPVGPVDVSCWVRDASGVCIGVTSTRVQVRDGEIANLTLPWTGIETRAVELSTTSNAARNVWVRHVAEGFGARLKVELHGARVESLPLGEYEYSYIAGFGDGQAFTRRVSGTFDVTEGEGPQSIVIQ